ncbi:CgeB family protein [Nocardia stercoris]|uniref:Glycosyltransferase family 1 protein n=1 Tax=Nocardia stercoris TaxID=2483361 RepID=A0A3M2L394_9NOCA|nr:glycosyltransferase [Nocardia stercoris]RMI32189.1 glycosyltransferase family 1 protein [Nocardia stercoris]
MKILYVGDDWVGSNARSLADGFREAGHEVVVVDTTAVTLPTRFGVPWTYSKVAGGRAPWTLRAVHDRIDRIAADFTPDLLFAFKSVHLDQERLLTVPAAIRVHYSPDDVANPENITRDYLDYEEYWDLIVTTKRHNVPELRERGARAVTFVASAYDPAWHRPMARRGAQRHAAGFIGARRPDRVELMTALANRYGPSLAVYGPGWRREPDLWRADATLRGPVYGEHFSTAVATMTANLVLLNSANRDTHTCRTFEIPAAGGLFVGERTSEHAELLAEGTECFLFSDRAELLDIIDRCDREPALAAKVAEAGYQRIVTGGHRYVDRAREIIDAVR